MCVLHRRSGRAQKCKTRQGTRLGGWVAHESPGAARSSWWLLCAGTGVAYPPFPAYTGPAILDYTQAAELDAQFFFSGTPWEMVGRNYTAQTLNLANGGNLTQYDVKSEAPPVSMRLLAC